MAGLVVCGRKLRNNRGVETSKSRYYGGKNKNTEGAYTHDSRVRGHAKQTKKRFRPRVAAALDGLAAAARTKPFFTPGLIFL